LPRDPQLAREMLGVGWRRTTSGNETISSRGAHDDRISAVVHAVIKASRLPPMFGYINAAQRPSRHVGPRPFGNVGGTAGGMLADVQRAARLTDDPMLNDYNDSLTRDRR
jgi:hypothetical protein